MLYNIYMTKSGDGPVTTSEFIRILDERFKASEARMSSAFDSILDSKLDAKLDSKIDSRIEELAGMVQRGFLAVDKRFDALDSRVDDLESTMNRRFDDVQVQIDNIYVGYTPLREHDMLKSRVATLERKAGIRASR